MHRLIVRLVPLAALLTLTGCGSSNPTPIAPAVPTTITDTFSGVLTLNGAATFPFTVAGVGGISALLTTLSPDSANPVGVSVGTWNGSICQIVLADDVSIQGSVVLGQSSAIGSFCVRIYDSAGTVVAPQTFTIEVTHL